MYELQLLPSAQRDLDRLGSPTFSRLLAKIQPLAQNPRPQGSIKLTGDEGHRLRIGDYRVLYRIDDQARIVYVYRVKHRREVYR